MDVHVHDRFCKIQVDGITWFLTYPQNDTAPGTALERVKLLLGDKLVAACIGLEKHQDGNPHLHVFLKTKRVKVTCAHYWDVISGKHGNYQLVRDKVKCLAYCTKDGNFVDFNMDSKAFLDQRKKRKSTKSDHVMKMLKEEKKMEEIIDEEGGFALLHLRQIKEMQSHLETLKMRKACAAIKPFRLIVSQPDLTQYEMRFGFDRSTKILKHFWFHGETAQGKTTRLLEPLLEYGIGFQVPANNDWVGYADGCFHFLYFDDFAGQIPIYLMNLLCDGNPVKLNVKGSSVIIKDKLPLIIISNKLPEEIYKDPRMIPAVIRRFNFVEVTRHTKFVFQDVEEMTTDVLSSQLDEKHEE